MRGTDLAKRTVKKTNSQAHSYRGAPTYEHYTNAVYMGTTKEKKRVGDGMLLYDNGVCGLVGLNQHE